MGEHSDQIKVTMDDMTSEGVYVNFANIVHNPTEYFIDFGRVVPGINGVKVMSRVMMTPYHAKQLLAALQQNISLYEQRHGEIKTKFDVKETPTADTAN